MRLLGVRLSELSDCLSHMDTAAKSLLLLWRWPGWQDISIDCCTAHSKRGGRMRAVSRCQRR